MYAIGLMSGTSLDALDIALCKISGHGIDTDVELIHFKSAPLPEDLKTKILEVSYVESSDVAKISSLNVELGRWYAQEVKVFLDKLEESYEIDFIASHGQTIHHIPREKSNLSRSTLQIGDPSFLAYEMNTKVVFNFRMMDIAAGGEGAPLVPYPEYVLYSQENKNILLQNIGGIGNVTFLPGNLNPDEIFAFDTGPGNMMINSAMTYFYNKPYDKDGEIAEKGEIIEPLFQELTKDPYYQIKPPKSTGREKFGDDIVHEICRKYSDQPEDVVATLTQFTAYTIAQSYHDFIFNDHKVDQIIIGGGGAYNPTLMKHLKNYLSEYELVTQEDLGLSSDAKEAIAFVILANETLYGNFNNIKGATGAFDYVKTGQIVLPPRA